MKSSARSMHDYGVLAAALVPSARHQASSRARASRQEQADFIHQQSSALHACARDSRPYRHTTHAMCTPAETTWPDPLRSIDYLCALYISIRQDLRRPGSQRLHQHLRRAGSQCGTSGGPALHRTNASITKPVKPSTSTHQHQDLHCIKPDYIDKNINVKLYDYIKL
jgi:hypothetical protein